MMLRFDKRFYLINSLAYFRLIYVESSSDFGNEEKMNMPFVRSINLSFSRDFMWHRGGTYIKARGRIHA